MYNSSYGPLEDIGMTPKEIDVYLALISLKSASIFELKSRAKTSRKSIYEILQRLLDKGLISYVIKDGRKMFSATHPARLHEILKEKEEELLSVLPGLAEKYGKEKEGIKVEVFLGNNGLKTALNNILEEGKTMYAVSGNDELEDCLPYYIAQFIKKRETLGIERKAVYNDNVRQNNIKIPLTEIRYAPKEHNSPIQFTVYGNNVNLLIFSDVPVAIHIQSEKIAEAFMNYFRLMWEIAKP